MKAILILIVLFIFFYKNNIEGQSFKKQEGFSSSEKDIRASFNMKGIIKRDKNGKICKIGERKKEKQDEEPIEDEKPLIIEKKGEPYPNNNFAFLKQNEILDELNEMRNDSQKKDMEKIVSRITRDINKLNNSESNEMKELMNKLDLLHLEIKQFKNNETIMNKLIDKIEVGTPQSVEYPMIQTSKKNNHSFILMIVLLVLFSAGGFIIYYLMTNKNEDAPITYREALMRAKKNILERKELI